MEYLKNDGLEIIRADWQGNPYQKGQFQYIKEPFYPSFRSLLKWQLSRNPQKEEKKADSWSLNIHKEHDYLTDKSRDFISWLGHASFLIQLNGTRLITDPMFSDLPFIPRLAPLPIPFHEIADLDYLLISHDHRDHCDKQSILTLLAHNQPKKILTALKLSSIIGNWVGGITIEEAAWFQKYDTDEGEPEIIFLPSRHWCRRGLTDFNQVLWGSYLIRVAGKTLYFGSDSGMGSHFAEIGKMFPDIDIAFIGIGAYKPDYMMQEIHTSPDEAWEAFRALGAKRLLPMHYGTYDLSDEPLSEPYYRIQEIFKEQGMTDQLLLPDMNEPVYL